MLETSTPELPDALRRLVDDGLRPAARMRRRARRPPAARRMRARRTAAIMIVFGIVLGGVEMFILLSYL
jgi:hypothetical protein